MSLPLSAAREDSEDWTYAFVILLLTIPLSAVVSNSFPLGAVVAYLEGTNSFDLGPYFVLWQLAVTVLMLLVFYKVGERVNFGRHYRRFAVLAFTGALIGNLPGFFAYQSFFAGGEGWSGGFGYVSSFGIPEPSALVDLITAASASFMIPLAGLALACFRFQLLSRAEADAGAGSKRFSGPLWSLVASFTIVVAALPVADLVSRLVPRFPPFHPDVAFLQLVPDYAGFLVYPILLLVVFYLMGRNLDLEGWGASRFRRFALCVFVGAAAGLFVGEVFGVLIAGASISLLFQTYNLELLAVDLISDGVIVVILAFAAASLGYFGSPRAPLGSTGKPA